MVDFVGTLQALSAGLKVLKDLNEVDRQYDQATLKLKIAELSSTLATAQIALAEAQTEAKAREAEIEALKNSFKSKDDLVEVRGFWYRKRSDGKPQGRAYCPKCLSRGHLMMTTKTNKPGRATSCPECKTEIDATEYTFEGE